MSEATEEIEKTYREHYTDEALKDRIANHHLIRAPEKVPSEYAILAAINETQYKYFGDYEFSGNQWNAVEVLVEAALSLIKVRQGQSMGESQKEKV